MEANNLSVFEKILISAIIGGLVGIIEIYSFEGDLFMFNASWEIFGWYGQTLENKPYISVDEFGRVYVADPEGGRVLVFSPEGDALGYWGSFEFGPSGFGLVSGLAADGQGGIWIINAVLPGVVHIHGQNGGGKIRVEPVPVPILT